MEIQVQSLQQNVGSLRNMLTRAEDQCDALHKALAEGTLCSLQCTIYGQW